MNKSKIRDEEVEMENFDDELDDNSKSEDIPKEQRKLTTQAYDKSVSDVVRMMSADDIHLNPEYQREYVWDNKKASSLIESILLNVPIPVIYVAQEEDDSWTVIDGLQRLYSLKRFFERDFKLTGLELLTDLNKADYKGLNPKAFRILNNGLLRIIVISFDSNPEIKYDIFMRLNRGSVKLNEQELRNCLYRGKANDLIKDMRTNGDYLKLLKIKTPHKRLMDSELILRFLAINDNWNPVTGNLKNYKGKMKSFLNDFMEKNRHISEEEKKSYRNCFETTIQKVMAVLGINAFRRMNMENQFETSLNRALMDCVMVVFEKFEESELVKKKLRIAQRLNELMINDKNFMDSITKATSDTKVIEYRLSAWYKALTEIME